MSGYIGAIPTPQATQSRDVYTATSNQTTFTTQGYTPNFVSVYLNGVHLARADFTATNGSDVVLASGATADDVVEIISFGTFQSADALPLTGGTMTGDLIVPDGDLILGSTAITATAAEINLIDGGTARGTTAVADGDGFLTNDGGTMRMTKVDTLATYMGTKIGGGMEFITSTGAISSAANVSFTQFDSSKYDAYDFFFFDVLPATDGAVFYARTSSDTSSHSYDSGANDYVKTLNVSTTGAFGQLNSTNQISNNTNQGMSMTVRVHNPHTSQHTVVSSINGVIYESSDDIADTVLTYRNAGFIREEAAQVNAIQFYFSSGNIASGEITMFGIVNS